MGARGERYFDGEVEPCINGRTIETGAYFGVDVAPIVERILGERLADGGWNCETRFGSVRSSFDTTINVLDGLLAFERAADGSDAILQARRSGEEYLLERGLFRRRSTGEVVKAAYLDFAFPYYWHYDVLRALDYFRRSGAERDPRMAEAVEVVRSKRQPDGRWLLDRVHPGRVHFTLKGGAGEPSRWNTLRALRVLDWWEGHEPPLRARDVGRERRRRHPGQGILVSDLPLPAQDVIGALGEKCQLDDLGAHVASADGPPSGGDLAVAVAVVSVTRAEPGT
jgi:hypothetical protein